RSGCCPGFTATTDGTRSSPPNARTDTDAIRGAAMRRALRPPAALAMLAVVVVVSAGCGGTRSSTGGDGNATREKAVKFAECMRANGVSAFPDPDASGELTIDAIANGSSVNTKSAVFEQALGACKDLEPPGFTGAKVTPKQRTARLEFAECVRDNGVPDFPDPTPNGPLVDTNRIPSAATTGGISILNAAMQKCRSYASAAGVHRSGGCGRAGRRPQPPSSL